MDSRTLKASLRVLYTVNNNPQYILAKSSTQVPTIVCSETTTQSQPPYARAPLKACLAAVCDSSPELLQDPARDFSLYVLDPLEAQPLSTSLAHTSHNTSSPRGVAVALGLMSWALESNDSTHVFVTGSIVLNPSPALEVVFAFRETRRMPKPIFHSYPPLGPISAPRPSQPLNAHHPPQAAGMSWIPTSQFHQEQQTLTRSADFPELYIGPPRRAPGRPEGSSSSRSKMKSRASTSSLPGASSSKVAETRSEFKQEVGRRSKQRTKPRPPRAPPPHSPFICEPLTRHTATVLETSASSVPAFHQQSHPFGQNQTQSHYTQPQPHFDATRNPLLGLLSTIASTSPSNMTANTTPEQQAALLVALQGLLATNPHLLQLAPTNTGLSASSMKQTGESKSMAGGSKADDEHDDTDSDIVILDSSIIDTAVFRKSNHRQPATSEDTSPLTTSQEPPMPSIQGTNSSPLPTSTPPSRQEGRLVSSRTSTPTMTPEAETPTSKHVYSRRTEKGSVASSHVFEMPATPSPSRTRKRKLDEYIQSGAHSSTLISPPSPSPSVARTSSSRGALTAKRIPSLPTGGTKLVSSPSVRLPSMLDSMRSLATSGSRLQAGPSGHGNPVSLLPNKNGSHSTTLVPGPSTSEADRPGNIDAPSNIASDTTLPKRRRTLNLSLNEVMEEREARKNAKVRKRPSSGCRLEVEMSANASKAAPLRSTKMVSTSRHTQSSPPRPLFRTNSVASLLPTSTRQPGSAPGMAISNLSATTSASTALTTFTSTKSPTKNPLKNFVLPAWARTSTAMLPRLSEEALARQRAEQEAKKAEVSLRRREAAKTKRKRLHATDHPSKESSDEDDDTVTNDSKPRTLHSSSSTAPRAPLLLPPPPSLPVFASDAVEPIPSSPPRSHRQPALPVVPSTPPRKPVSSGPPPHRTPSKSGSCSLFTPSGQDQGSLFTPSTPSITPLTRATFTPRSPTVLHHSGARKSPRKSVPHTPWTPKRNGANHQTPRSLRSGRNAPFGSPGLVMRTPQMQTGIGTRAFLLPPPSPCTLRTPHLQNQVCSKVPGRPTPITPEDSGITKQEPSPDKQNVDRDKGLKEERLSCEPDNAYLGEDMSIPLAQCSPSRLTIDDDQEIRDLRDITFNGGGPQAGEEYASSPLPPSSPLPASAFSSPAKHHDSDVETPTINNLVVPDSDILLPSASDSDGSQKILDPTWLSDDACKASWFTDSEVNAWLTDTEAWLTDTEGGGPLLTDSDGAWLSDSDAVFGDMSSLPPSSASNWLSDDADIDTDGECGAMEGRAGAFDTAAFEMAFAALVERGGQSVSVVDKEQAGGSGTARSTREVESGFWESVRPLLAGNSALDNSSKATGDVADSVDGVKVEQGIQELLDGLVGT